MVEINGALKLTPQATAPAGATEGELYYDSVTKKLKVHDGTAQVDVGGLQILYTANSTPLQETIQNISDTVNNVYTQFYSKTFTTGSFGNSVRFGIYASQLNSNGGILCYIRIKKNGITQHTFTLQYVLNSTFFFFDIAYGPGDTITFERMSVDATGNYSIQISSFGIYGTEVIVHKSVID